MFHGQVPDPSLLQRLAPALGLHAADLFVIAGAPVPDDLAPVDANAGRCVPRLVEHAMFLSPEHRDELRRLVESLPQEEHARLPAPRPPKHEQYPAGPGALLLRMLRNRNLAWTGTATTFLLVTGRYWSASTYGMVGHGRKQLTPDLLLDFSAVLGIPAADLAALTDVALPDEPSAPKPTTTAGVAELIWDVRRLTADQLRQVGDIAESMRPGCLR
ncbi:hypothetical protein FNH04_37585 [Streptomyces phyllanthi]|uniref:Uncharacterized protein n=1 Tax=Streptomyces phyllanthi TaxID=1803180 RepID=A0A5N8WD63_9ACTN|nr:hypothetical protein [Streptomyces phyllanthi]